MTANNLYKHRRRSISKDSNYSRGAKSSFSVEKSYQKMPSNKHKKHEQKSRVDKSKPSNIGSPASRRSKSKTISDNTGAGKKTAKVDFKEWRRQQFERLNSKRLAQQARLAQADNSHDSRVNKSKLANQRNSHDEHSRAQAPKQVSAYIPSKPHVEKGSISKHKESTTNKEISKNPVRSPYQTEKKHAAEVRSRPSIEAFVPRSEMQSEEIKKLSEKENKAKHPPKQRTEFEPMAPRIQSPFNFDDLPDIPKLPTQNVQKPKPFIPDRISDTSRNNSSVVPKSNAHHREEREGFQNKRQEDYAKSSERQYSAYIPKHILDEQAEKQKKQKDDHYRKRKRSASREDYHKTSKHSKHSESYKEFDYHKDKSVDKAQYREKQDSNQDRHFGYQNIDRDRSSISSDKKGSKYNQDKEMAYDRQVSSSSPEKRREKKANRSPSIDFPEPKNLNRPDSDRKLNDLISIERIDSNNDSIRQQLNLTPKVQHVVQESPTLLYMNQTVNQQQSAESEAKISPVKTYDEKEKQPSNLESEILNDVASDSVNSKDDF